MPSSQLRANRTENTSYVYRYIRLDKNEPFYIGISYKEDDFKRAYDVHERRRNKIFKDIIKKSPYEIEILFTNLTWEQACEKEKEFIKLYGRKNIKTGTLANMTDGGDGSTGVVLTDEQRKARSIQSKGLKRTEESRRKNSQAKLKYYQENPQAREIISKRMKALPVDYDRLKRMAEKNRKPVVMLTLDGEFIRHYESSESTRKDGFAPSGVTASCVGRYKTHKGYKFVYLKNYKKD